MIEARGFHPPRQARSRATLDALTSAVAEHLVETGEADVSVRELVDRARTSVGAFYARFDDREAALAYASHDFWARSRELWSGYLAPDGWDGASAARVVPTLVRSFARTMLADRIRMRAFVRLSLAVKESGLLARVADHDRFVAVSVADLLASRAGQIRHPDPRLAAEDGFRIVLSAVRDRVVFDAVDANPETERRWILGLAQMYGRHLDVHPVPRSYAELLRMTWSPMRFGRRGD